MLKHFFLVTSVLAGALLGTGSVQAQTIGKTDYAAVVGIGVSRGFNTIQKPELLYRGSYGTNQTFTRLSYALPFETSGRWKFFLPPGTVGFNANLLYYLAPQEGKAVLRLNNLPTTPFSSVNINHAAGPLNETVLLNLIRGDEVLRYSAGAPANSLPLSLPDEFIDPMSSGGYVYGNYQYPGGMLSRAELEVIVRADCYERWFRSSATKWDESGNPDENATHTCEGSSGGDPNVELQGVSTSLPTLQAGTSSTTLTLLPDPANAVLRTCVAQEPKYVVVSGTQVSLLPAASTLTASAQQTIVCDGKSVEFTILPPAPSGGYTLWTEGEPLTFTSSSCTGKGQSKNYQYLNDPSKSYDRDLKKWVISLKSPNEVADGTVQEINCVGIGDISIIIKVGNGPATGDNTVKIENARISQNGLLEFKLVRPEGNYSGKTTTWIAARIPVSAKVFPDNKEYWFFLTSENGWQLQILEYSDSAKVAYHTRDTQKVMEFSVPLGLTVQELQAYGAEIHFGYRDQEGVFQNKGIVWPTPPSR